MRPVSGRVSGVSASTVVGARRGLVALCITVTTDYGVLFYAFPVLAPSITADTGWSLTTVTALLSASQVIAGLAGIPVGLWVQARGPRSAMAAAALLAAPSMVAIALAPNPWVFAAWLVAGAAMAGLFYPPAFATGNPDHREMFTLVNGDEVTWADGTVAKVDPLLLATGYRPALDYLTPTGALNAQGRPLHRGGISTTVPRLGEPAA